MKKTTVVLTIALLALTLIAGCASPAVADVFPEPSSVAVPAPTEPPVNLLENVTQDNDILTYEPLDPDKVPLVVSRTGNIYMSRLNEAFEAANPDIQIICIDITGGSKEVSPLRECIENGQAPDVVFTMSNTFPDDEALEYFTNLSANPVVNAYETEALNQHAVDGNVYWLPGPSQVYCMVYNKTLFEQYGWEVPATFDEFAALCVQIREDTDGTVQPWNPNAKYDNEYNKVMAGFAYGELYGGVDNRTWYNEFTSGNGTFAGHMEPYYEMVQTLIDNKLLLPEHFTYSATTRGKEFQAGQIAMINFNATLYDSDEYEFGMIPFPSTDGEVGYVNTSFNCLVGIPQKERSEAEQEAVQRYLEFFSSQEGQQAFIDSSLMISNVKDIELNNAEFLSGLQPAIAAGHMFIEVTFYGSAGSPKFSLYDDGVAMLNGERTGAQCIAAVDADPYITQTVESAPPEAVATAAENFTILETSNYMADMYREKAGADIGLIADNLDFRGNLMRIFAGDLTSNHVTVLKPRSFDNESTLVKVKMTGAQLLSALNDPMGNERTADCIYAFSGLKCEVAPWNAPGSRYLSVTLADGTLIDESAEYTVACWSGTVFDKYITEVLETYDGSWEELMTEKLAADGTVAPAKDGRITLVWE